MRNQGTRQSVGLSLQWLARPSRLVLLLIVSVSVLLPGPKILGEWESLTVFAVFADRLFSLDLRISPHANVGGQGYFFLELSRYMLQIFDLPQTLPSLRLPVRLLGALGLVGFYLIGKRWFGVWPSLVGTALLSVNSVYHQYQNELVIVGPSLVIFIWFLERVQVVWRHPDRLFAWISMSIVWAALLTMYGPSRIYSALVVGALLIWALIRRRMIGSERSEKSFVLRLLATSALTIVVLILTSPVNLSRIGSSLLIPPVAESAFVGGSSSSLISTVWLNAQILSEAMLLGGGSFHSSFVEATLVQGRYPLLHLGEVLVVAAGLILSALNALRRRRNPENRFVAILCLALLTSVPLLSSSIITTDSGPVPTLVTHRLVFALVPAFLSVCALAAWASGKGRTTVRMLMIVAVVMYGQGVYSILRSNTDFDQRRAAIETAITGDARHSQWLDGFGRRGTSSEQASHFQQHEQYVRWARDAEKYLTTKSNDSIALIVADPRCFPEAMLVTRSLSEINDKHYLPIFLALYLAAEANGQSVAFVHVPPRNLKSGFVMLERGLYPGGVEISQDGAVEHRDPEVSEAKLTTLRSDNPAAIIATTPLEFQAGKRLLQEAQVSFEVVNLSEVCGVSMSQVQ